MQVPQRVRVQLGTIEALVPGEAAAQHFIHLHHVRAAALCDAMEAINGSHLAYAAYRVDGNAGRLALDRDTGQHRVMQEFDAVLHRESFTEVALHPIGAGTRVEHDWQAAPVARVAQRRLQLARLAVGRVGKALALERLPAAQLGQLRRVDHVETGLREQPLGRHRQRIDEWGSALRADVARGAAGKIDDGIAATL